MVHLLLSGEGWWWWWWWWERRGTGRIRGVVVVVGEKRDG